MYKKTLGRAAWPTAATTVAALLAGIVLSGCGSSATPSTTSTTSSASTTPSTGTTTSSAASASSQAAGPVLAAPSGPGTCYQWSGVGTLNAAAFPLREAASDMETGEYGSSDQLAINVALTALAGDLNQLPEDWADAIQNQVISPGYGGDSTQLSAAASNAQSLATDISQLCYTP